MKRLTLITLSWLLLVSGPACAESFRMVPDPGANHYEALAEFLEGEGYWPEDLAAVLDPLEEKLDRNHGTHRVFYVSTMEDIPGLRPLPDGVISFVHRRQNVFYVDIADDPMLLGISKQVERENGRTQSTVYNFEKLDLINGLTDNNANSGNQEPLAMKVAHAHGNYLGAVIRLFAVGLVVMVFLGARLRKQAGVQGDPVVLQARRDGDLFGFKVAGTVWLFLLAAMYGFIHFAAHSEFLGMVAGSYGVSYGLTERLILNPDRLRLISFVGTMSVALLSALALGLWAGVFRRFQSDHEGENP